MIQAIVAGLANFAFFSPAQEAARHNLNAIKALDDAHRNRQEYGARRRGELKQWAEEQRRLGLSDVQDDQLTGQEQGLGLSDSAAR